MLWFWFGWYVDSSVDSIIKKTKYKWEGPLQVNPSTCLCFQTMCTHCKHIALFTSIVCQLHSVGVPLRLGTVDQRAPRHNLISLSFKSFSTLRSNPGLQYELWPWISTGLGLVFNVHQRSMWESSPHSGVLLTQPSPSCPSLGPSGLSQVPNHTSVSTVAKLFQSDWHPSVWGPEL